MPSDIKTREVAPFVPSVPNTLLSGIPSTSVISVHSGISAAKIEIAKTSINKAEIAKANSSFLFIKSSLDSY